MKRWSLAVLTASVFLQCGSDKNYDPNSMLSPHEKDEVIMKIIRYASKAPENVSDVEKFNSKYDGYYQQRASECRLEQYCIDGNTRFFLMSQPAPSLVEKRHATGGKMILDRDGNLIEYEETFRTWKLTPDTLKKRSYFLFDKMVRGESLDPYLTKNSKVEYIEFPDDHTYYDKTIRAWRTN